jgi:hypothetical protein
MRRSTELSLPLQVVFPALTHATSQGELNYIGQLKLVSNTVAGLQD